MSGIIKAASTDQFAEVKLWTIATGQPKTDADHTTSGLTIKYQLGNGVVATLTALSMSPGGSHVDGGIYHRGNGVYKIGLPDGLVSAVGILYVWLELADCDSSVDSIRVVGYDADSVAVGALTAVDEVDIGSVKGAAVASVNDFKATGFAVAGDAMNLTSAERSATAGVVDTVLTAAHGSGSWTTAISSGGGATAQEVWEYSTRGLTEDVTTDAASRNASKADVATALQTYDAPTRSEATADKDEVLSAVSGISTGSGSGARTVTLTVRNTDGDLIPGATVRMQNGGENYSKALLTGTDSVGRDDGIWTVTTTAVNHSSDVRSVTISADTPIEITLTAVTIQAPAASGTATGVALVLDETNQPEAGVECSAVLVNGNGSTGKFRSSEEWKATSDGDGLVQWNALEHGATYRFYRGGRYASSDYVEATIAAVQSFEIGELVA